jgi:uncharacterized protein YqfA (UPF0365 family)
LAIAIVLLILGAIIVVFSIFFLSFQPESAQWLSIASGGANIALGAFLIRLSAVARTRKGV